MKIGFDVDGVLANFIRAFQPLVVKHAGGVNLFSPTDIVAPPTWHWPQYRGYSDALMDFKSGPVWSEIKRSEEFWLNLEPLPDVATLRMLLPDLVRYHDLYFITNRFGPDVKWQTEQWLLMHLVDASNVECGFTPTVLVSGEKGLCAQALGLDVYVDDYGVNANDVVVRTTPPATPVGTLPRTRTYLLERSYNADVKVDARVRVVKTLGEMFDREL